MNESVNLELVDIALDKVEGFAFERFSQSFFSALEGREFVPLGGVKDGGADGIYECGKSGTFYQFTRVSDHRAKIRGTYKRLKEFGRDVRVIIYMTPRAVSHIDREEELLTEELDVIVRIRDKKYISSHINDTVGTISAYHNNLATYTHYLEYVPKQKGIQPSGHVNDPSAFVFLQHEVTNRLGNRKLVHSVTDTLILWGLSETDPDKNIFMTESEIYSKITSNFPWAEKIIKPHLSKRLEKMRTKDEMGREVRYYGKKGNKYCLPYETRKVIKEENSEDESLKICFLDEIRSIASEDSSVEPDVSNELAELTFNIVHSIFERQGLLFSHFLSTDDETDPPPIVHDCIDDALVSARVNASKVEYYREKLELIIRRIFYKASPKQREYFNNLSRTYVLLFSLQTEPRVVEYFSNLSASFRLFLGSDILVKALSERYLDKEDQVARNLLRVAIDSGMSLLLSECVVDEVYTHVKGTYYEFINYFAEMEPYITDEISRNSGKILIRSYFYAKNEGKVRGWKQFLEQFVTYSNIEKPLGRDEIKRYLISEFRLEYVDNSELESISPEKRVKELAQRMMANEDKKHETLAYNTALQVYGVYGLRNKNKETSKASEFGLKTWWMTNQTRVVRHTVELVREKGHQYIMRPEYILNFISMSPSCVQARESFKTIFPSIFGIQLGHRLKDDAFHKIMHEVGTWKDLEPGRISTLMADLSDRLKTDRMKRYEYNLNLDSN
ncbi:hypothetical protein KQ940_01275 [Marinobacterium sp. D7]|uniref:hypothetical protein n=1 Tax=Marinobacterium ramblicola TaxID=2849041 RepID=UPI001C2D523A|nr:hypothetical protein [Marinobacterium ramblicola]MBV1786681.1 hypothetical protein [Marinobacterium ramblicola]